MTSKMNDLLRYGVTIVIIAAILGGCKKDPQATEEAATQEKTSDTATTEPVTVRPGPPVDNEEVRKQMENDTINEVSDLDNIISAGGQWQAALKNYYGKDAPNMILKDIDGKQHSITALKNKNTIIVKWMSRVEESKEMLKVLDDVQREVGANELAIIAISSEDPALLKPVVESLDIDFPVIGRPHRLVDPYRTIRDTPVCFFIDKDSKIQLIAIKKMSAETVKEILEAM